MDVVVTYNTCIDLTTYEALHEEFVSNSLVQVNKLH